MTTEWQRGYNQATVVALKLMVEATYPYPTSLESYAAALQHWRRTLEHSNAAVQHVD